ncbi:deoxyguanosinetriphosphate triphosphohydrolase [bacterium]|nr:deoxyguanosinetriphosphate triphosphohydrolase [candidate division CSSED10-310 bacterium]
MRYRTELERTERHVLASFATLASNSRGRSFPEEESITRTCFQRDVDRIVHSKAFRRLEYKTQVFVNYEGDHYRTRLTHTLEVAYVAKALARSLGLNGDLVEAIAFAHDLGHTPFGHAGEQVLNELTSDVGGFEHNRQSLRMVEMLENKYPKFHGLNLSWEVREGLIKHTSIFDQPEVRGFEPEKQVSLEGQIVNLADELAYNCHDLEDGLRSGILEEKELKDLTLWRQAESAIAAEKMPVDFRADEIIRHIKDSLVINALTNSLETIIASGIITSSDARNWTSHVISFDMTMTESLKELSNYLLENFYYHHRVIRMTSKAKMLMEELFKRYLDTPRLLPEKVQETIRCSGEPKRVICDYIAGMTDRFALDEYRKIIDPLARV